MAMLSLILEDVEREDFTSGGRETEGGRGFDSVRVVACFVCPLVAGVPLAILLISANTFASNPGFVVPVAYLHYHPHHAFHRELSSAFPSLCSLIW
jgi:hypothetical protein